MIKRISCYPLFYSLAMIQSGAGFNSQGIYLNCSHSINRFYSNSAVIYSSKSFSTFVIPYSKNKTEHLVIDKLIWEDDKGKSWYKVFGSWKCDSVNKKTKNCVNKWSSAFTWISYEKYLEKVSALKLDKNTDYLQQACRKCNNKVNVLIKYKHLEKSDVPGEFPHRSDLCAKCKSGSLCNLSKMDY